MRMTRQHRVDFVQTENRNIQPCARASLSIANGELGLDLLLHSGDEFRATLRVKRHDNHSAQQTTKETRDPLRAVFGPEQDAITFSDLVRFQFARELIGLRGY